jgi:nucleotide-binding universal stress UspA family protein
MLHMLSPAVLKQILVAVDEHPHAEQIVDSAIQLAVPMAARIILLYVVADKSVPEGYVDTHGDALPEHYYQDQFLRTVGQLLKHIERAGIKCEGMCGVGDPQEEILKAAKSNDVSYIVVGASRFRYLSRLKAFGNVGRSIIENSTVPVLAIP